MEILEKARILGQAGEYDSCGPKACEVSINSGLGGIYNAKAEHKTCRLFKTLMDNSCSFDCKYCSNSAGCRKQKASYEPKELASLFNHIQRTLRVEGLFLSSGVAGDPDKVTEKMIDAVRIIRFQYRFRGYVHFKVLPGVSRELIKQASEISNRMSINIEAPNKDILSELSTCKDYRIDILRRQKWISKLSLRNGQTTQVIVNRLASDKDILRMADWEYKTIGLKRIYFSTFRPVPGTPLENDEAEPLWREHRLYNVDFLMNKYGYDFKEFSAIMDNGMLPREDPKLALAKSTFERHVDVNEAPYERLIRIPGIGPKTAKRIAGGEKVKSYKDLAAMGASVRRARPFIEVGGRRQRMLSEF